jgi:hypothetical protein
VSRDKVVAGTRAPQPLPRKPKPKWRGRNLMSVLIRATSATQVGAVPPRQDKKYIADAKAKRERRRNRNIALGVGQ